MSTPIQPGSIRRPEPGIPVQLDKERWMRAVERYEAPRILTAYDLDQMVRNTWAGLTKP